MADSRPQHPPDDARLEALARDVASHLEASEQVVTLAESCTGGWIAKLLTDIAGSSAWFGQGLVTYSNTAKSRLLGVPDGLLAEHGAVSEEVVRRMASGALETAQADVAIAVSGVAGPGGGTAAKPVGTVWLGWALRSGFVISRRECFSGDRDDVRRAAVAEALAGFLRHART